MGKVDAVVRKVDACADDVPLAVLGRVLWELKGVGVHLAGADVNPATMTGIYDNPLAAAARRRHIEIVDFLFKAGADMNITLQ